MRSPAFFDGVRQEEVRFGQYRAKSPLFVRDLSMIGAAFTADLARLRRALPDRSCEPLAVSPKHGLVALHCFEYKDTDIGPYNEVAVSIAVRAPGRTFLPGPVDVLRSLASDDYHAHVFQLPVTTEVAAAGGIEFFNFPKFRADIVFRETAGHRVCTLRDAKTLDLILEFEGRKIRTRTRARAAAPSVTTLNSYPRVGGRLCRARMAVNRRRAGQGPALGDCALWLGKHALAEPLKGLRIGWPVWYWYAPQAEAILFPPEPA